MARMSVGAWRYQLPDDGGLVGLYCTLQQSRCIGSVQKASSSPLPLHLPTVQILAAIPYCNGQAAIERKSVHDSDVVGLHFAPAPNRGP